MVKNDMFRECKLEKWLFFIKCAPNNPPMPPMTSIEPVQNTFNIKLKQYLREKTALGFLQIIQY